MKEKERKVQEEETGSACIYVIMDPTEKSEMSRREASTKDEYVSIYGYTCMRKKKEKESERTTCVLFRSNGPAAITV